MWGDGDLSELPGVRKKSSCVFVQRQMTAAVAPWALLPVSWSRSSCCRSHPDYNAAIHAPSFPFPLIKNPKRKHSSPKQTSFLPCFLQLTFAPLLSSSYLRTCTKLRIWELRGELLWSSENYHTVAVLWYMCCYNISRPWQQQQPKKKFKCRIQRDLQQQNKSKLSSDNNPLT
jgi:hypothetical protein